MTSFAVVMYIITFPPYMPGRFIVVVALTRYVSLGSMVGAVFWPIVSLFIICRIGGWLPCYVGFGMRHKDNIKRLFDEQKKLSLKIKMI